MTQARLMTLFIALLCTNLAHTMEVSFEQKLESLKRLCINSPAASVDFKAIEEARSEITADHAELVRNKVKVQTELENSSIESTNVDVYCLELVRILVSTNEDVADTLLKILENEKVNQRFVGKLIAKLGIEFRNAPFVTGNVKKNGLSDDKIRLLLIAASKCKSRKVVLDAVDLLTGYDWQQANVRPVDKELGLELLSEKFKSTEDKELLEDILKRKLYFSKEQK